MNAHFHNHAGAYMPAFIPAPSQPYPGIQHKPNWLPPASAAPPPPSAPSGAQAPISWGDGPQITWVMGQDKALMRVQDCLKFFDCGKSKFYSWLNPKSKYHAAEFPRPIYLNGGRVPYWRRSEIIAWVDMQRRSDNLCMTGLPTGLI